MDVLLLEKYIHVFGNLNRNKDGVHGRAPHKPVLLLSVLDEIHNGRIQSNLICLTPELMLVFEDYWKVLVQDPYWRMRIETPFRHLMDDGFWNVMLHDQPAKLEPRRTYTSRQLREHFDGVHLSPDLWTLLQFQEARDTLRNVLLQAYFQVPVFARPDATVLVNYEAEKLKLEAYSKFRVKRLRERTDSGYYARHLLFPKVIKENFDFRCAVCGVSTRMPSPPLLVEAAHILPFAEFHYDHPRNGIALCKNHHWGFDKGAFTIDDDYSVRYSSQLQNPTGFVVENKQIYLPSNPEYAPAPEALQWHRENKFVE